MRLYLFFHSPQQDCISNLADWLKLSYKAKNLYDDVLFERNIINNSWNYERGQYHLARKGPSILLSECDNETNISSVILQWALPYILL